MARRRKDPHEEKKPRRGGARKPGSDGDREPPENGGEQYPPGNPDADPVRIHREYVEQHLEGGRPATPDEYARALRQWHELPGAVRRPATELGRLPSEEETNEGDEEDGAEEPR
jgi:hypothetical protein